MTEDYCWGCPNNKSKDRCGFCGRELPTEQAARTGRLWKELADTKKKLDICVKALNKIANTDIKVIEKEPLYYARAMFSVTNNALNRIQDIEQIEQKDVK